MPCGVLDTQRGKPAAQVAKSPVDLRDTYALLLLYVPAGAVFSQCPSACLSEHSTHGGGESMVASSAATSSAAGIHHAHETLA